MNKYLLSIQYVPGTVPDSGSPRGPQEKKVQNVTGAMQKDILGSVGAQSRSHYFLCGEGFRRGRAEELPTTWSCLGNESYNMELFHMLLDLLARLRS